MTSRDDIEELVKYIHEKTRLNKKTIRKVLETERDYFLKQIIN